MLAEWVRSGLDLILIVFVGVGLVQATRLIWHLSGLRASRAEMERFVHDFNSTVMRAEAGIKGLKMAARESGDDLEHLVSKAVMVRDELQFITESADQLADRITSAASQAVRPDPKPEKRTDAKPDARVPDTRAKDSGDARADARKPQMAAAKTSPVNNSSSSAVVSPLNMAPPMSYAPLPPAAPKPGPDAPSADVHVEKDPAPQREASLATPRREPDAKPASRAEKELMQALEKLN